MEKCVGIVKEIDKLGRIVIPKDFRDRLKLGKEVEVVLTKAGILIRSVEYELTKKENK
ncbi:MAG: division/cell wall cluster transcriptional repressor MraZ [Clostridia bacterium]|nr:division/cell wall cluster transcriptional repressor MraZ [Clostridia bacterium]